MIRERTRIVGLIDILIIKSEDFVGHSQTKLLNLSWIKDPGAGTGNSGPRF